MEYWNAFIRFEYASEVMMAFGAMLVFWSVISIIQTSFKLVIWVIFAGIGATSLSFGISHSPLNLPSLNSLSIADIKNMAPGINADVLQFLCQKLVSTPDS